VKPGTSGDQRETIVDSAEPGEKPAGVVVEKASMTATIEQIDRTVPSITLRDQDEVSTPSACAIPSGSSS
jgi:hypothetical protein